MNLTQGIRPTIFASTKAQFAEDLEAFLPAALMDDAVRARVGGNL